MSVSLSHRAVLPWLRLSARTHALLHGRFADALAFNLLFVVGVPLAAIVWIVNRRRSQPIELRPLWAWWLVAILVAFGIVRNVPVYPFSLLAPHVRVASIGGK